MAMIEPRVPQREAPHAPEPFGRRLASVAWEIAPLSVCAFGGAPAQFALAHDRFVRGRRWLSDARFLEVLSIASAIPGPTATQVITAMGLFRAGPLGGLLALVVWILPGAVVLTAAGVGARNYLDNGLPEWMAGLAPAAVSLVVLAAVRLWQKAVGDDLLRATVAAVSSCVILSTQGLSSLVFPGVMAIGGGVVLFAHVTGWKETHVAADDDRHTLSNLQQQIGLSAIGGALLLGLWLSVLLAMAALHPQDITHHTLGTMFYAFFWIGSIVFGGGQVMLPMLLDDFVRKGFVSEDQFLAGFALVQALPTPAFNIAAYLGAVLYGPLGAIVATAGLFGPGIGLLFGLLALWERVRGHARLKVFLAGVNAAACGLVVASIFLLWEKAVHSNAGAVVGLATGLMVGVFNVPSPLSILLGAALGYLLSSTVVGLGQEDFCTGA